jgi:hypothetical protein
MNFVLAQNGAVSQFYYVHPDPALPFPGQSGVGVVDIKQKLRGPNGFTLAMFTALIFDGSTFIGRVDLDVDGVLETSLLPGTYRLILQNRYFDYVEQELVVA